MHLMPLDELYSLNDESDNDGSDSGSACTRAFTFCFDDFVGHVENYVGRVYDMGSGVFVPVVIESNCDVVPLVVFLEIGVESKGG